MFYGLFVRIVSGTFKEQKHSFGPLFIAISPDSGRSPFCSHLASSVVMKPMIVGLYREQDQIKNVCILNFDSLIRSIPQFPVHVHSQPHTAKKEG